MKRKLAIVIIMNFLCVLLLSSCSGGTMLNKIFGNKKEQFFNKERAEENAKMDEVLEAIKNKDNTKLKELFSKNVISQLESFEQNIMDLFDYYQGEVVSYDDWGGSGGEETWDYGNKQKILYLSYDVKTTYKEYRFAIKYIIVDTDVPDNVGIYSLYIIKMEDDIEPQLGYRGDNKFTPGIHIGVKNTLPKEDDSISVVSSENKSKSRY